LLNACRHDNGVHPLPWRQREPRHPDGKREMLEEEAMERMRFLPCTLALLLHAAIGNAQTFPDGPMRIIAPYPPGGGTDILARAIGKKLGERLGHSVVVENRPGANGTVGTAAAAQAAPDGRTMVVVAAGYAAGASLYKKLPFD